MTEGVSKIRALDWKAIDWLPICLSALVLISTLWMLSAHGIQPSLETQQYTGYLGKAPTLFDAIGAWIDRNDASMETFSTLVVAIFTMVLAWSTKGLWQETKRLAEGADDQSKKMAASIQATNRLADTAVTAQRPWLSLEVEITGDLLVGEGMQYAASHNIRLPIRIIAKNCGTTPVLSAFFRSELCFYATSGRPHSIMDLYLGPYLEQAGKSAIPDFGTAIFPEGSHIDGTEAAAELDVVRGEIVETQTSYCGVRLICWVDYVYAGGSGYTLVDMSLTAFADDLVARIMGYEKDVMAIPKGVLELGAPDIYAR